MSKRLFLKKFITENKQTGAILPSSRFLARRMVNKDYILNSNVIVEFGAGSGKFTSYILKYSLESIENKKIFIFEKDKDFYDILIDKFPEFKHCIYNEDVLNIEKVLKENGVEKVDLVISGLPFKSLPIEIFNFIINNFFSKYLDKDSKFIQFSYFKNFSKILADYFNEIEIESCFINIPKAYIFDCSNFKNK